MDTALAMKHVSYFLQMCDTSVSAQEADLHGYVTEREDWKELARAIAKELPIVQAIAQEVDPSIAALLRQPDMTLIHENRRAAALQLQAVLESQDEVARVMGPSGPKLAASELHPWVWDHASRLWSDGHPREAVRAAAIAIFSSHLPAALNLSKDIAPEALCAAFKTEAPGADQPRLRIRGYEEGTEDYGNAGSPFLLALTRPVRSQRGHQTVVERNPALASVGLGLRFDRLPVL